MLAKFYEAEEVIRAIRSHFGESEEGKSRQRAENETREQRQALDRAYVVFERYSKHRELFAELQSMKSRYMATFGKSACEPFSELCGVLNDISSAARVLGEHYWSLEMSGQLTERQLPEKHKCENIFWGKPKFRENEDGIAIRVTAAVHKVEEYLKVELRAQSG